MKVRGNISYDRVEELIKMAEEGKNSEIEEINSFGAYLAARSFRRTTRKIRRALNKTLKLIVKDYTDSLLENKSSLEIVLTIKRLECVIHFCDRELETYNKIIQKYEYALMGKDRFFGDVLGDYDD